VNPNLRRLRTCVLSILCLAGLLAAFPQSRVACGEAQPTRIATIDLQQAIWATAEGKRVSAELKERFGPRESELDALNVQIENIRRELFAGQTLGTADAQQQRRLEGARLVAQFNRKKRELTEDLQTVQQEILKHLTVNMVQIVSDYAATHGYMVVFDSSKPRSEVAYKARGTDLTNEIIRLYDEAHP
jgi:Skp family chaperone for outer membrane proteins